MAVFGIQKKTMTISIPMAAFHSLQKLAVQEGKTPTQYVRALVIQHLDDHGLPLYCIPTEENE